MVLAAGWSWMPGFDPRSRNDGDVTSPSPSSVAGTVVSLQIEASDSAGRPALTYTAAGSRPGCD